MNLVVGSTGLLGAAITRRLLERQLPVRALVRGDVHSDSRIESVRGDLKDRPSLDRACAGVTTVITTANSAQRGGDDNVESVDMNGNLSLIEAARNAGVRNFIFVSAAAVSADSPVPLFAAKARTEQALRDSGMTWTVIAPHVFMDVWFPAIIGSALAAGRPVSLVNGGTKRHSFVAVDDVAAFTAAAVGNPTASNRRLLIGGPEGLSWSEVVERCGRLIGRKLAVETIAAGSPIPSLPPPLDVVIGQLAAGLEQHDVVFDTSGLAREFDVELTPPEKVLQQMLASG